MSRSLQLLVSTLAVASLAVNAHPTHTHQGRALERKWYHDDDHPVNKLFPRVSDDGGNYPELGSSTWTAAFPEGTPTGADMPQEWKDALAAAVAAGKIPDIAQSDTSTGYPVYPNGLDGEGEEVCSATYKCRADGDIWDAPEGIMGLGFDDGPWLGTEKLAGFLDEQNERATHYVIGLNILHRPQDFKLLVDRKDDLCVHTYTHRLMTGLSNEDVVAELGWTLEIIRQSTGGRISNCWRPPTGDADNRVRAIASEIFGLDLIMWNQDTWDWKLSTGGTTEQAINTSMTTWLSGPKNPGLIILEHELSEQTVQMFMNAWPLVKSQGWQTKSQAVLFEESSFQNSNGLNDDPVTSSVIIQPHDSAPASTDASTDSSAPTGSSDSGATTTRKPTGTGSSSQTSAGSNSSSTTTPDGAASLAGSALFASVMAFLGAAFMA
ncbi:carbohydrate esterase family 4 protein [Cylindrobasidium torrendii FP15055 ss-10]|uniref:chitin deacetylase n=1 Tax=Cylindrobasidium torrendii FP15055 ss-10 TaxID=1314674 RepID=A0A0D7B570_9AGAR|nr:carbohydrate esterase family 4 protein [Cylindrobasidium torrendii FP15055 ss-10]